MSDDTVNWKIIVCEIVKKDPIAVIEAYNNKFAPWKNECRVLVANNRLADVVRVWKKHCHCTVKEALDAVKALV